MAISIATGFLFLEGEKMTCSSLTSTWLKAVATASLLCASSAALAVNSQVHLNQGTVIGKVDHSVQSWLGVPYAQAPIGHLRWQIAKPLPSATTTFQAVKQGAICPQMQKDQVVGDEDCLNLNIYRPNTDETLPVLLYIHGGNNQTGKADEFNPTQLALATKSVVVTVNYRLGVLGFNPLKAIKTAEPLQASGNFGLLDQSAALDWIKHNIHQFGGDSNNITVSGFSAGGRDVMAMLISPVFKDKFQHAIVFSGGMTTAPVKESQTVFAKAFAPLAVEDGRQPDLAAAEKWLKQGDSEVKAYLQSLSPTRLAKLMQNAGIRMSVFPHLYTDGTVLPSQGFDKATYNQVPTMMLTGANEFSFFALGDPEFAATDWNNQPHKAIEYDFVFRYGGLLYSAFNVEESVDTMLKAKFSAPIYAGKINYGSDPIITGPAMTRIGSFHGVFIPLLDSSVNMPMFGNAFKTEGAQQLAHDLEKHIAAFIRQGKPSNAIDVEWKPWNKTTATNGESLYVFDANTKNSVLYRTDQAYQTKDIIELMDQDYRLSEEDKSKLIHSVLNGRWFSQQLDEHYHSPSLW